MSGGHRHGRDWEAWRPCIVVLAERRTLDELQEELVRRGFLRPGWSDKSGLCRHLIRWGIPYLKRDVHGRARGAIEEALRGLRRPPGVSPPDDPARIKEIVQSVRKEGKRW